jgi:nicotinamidase-related amidase
LHSRGWQEVRVVDSSKDGDLHGNAPDTAPVALLLIDVVNDLEFPDGETVLRQALPMARRVARLKQRCKDAGIPVVYVNDNFGKWRSEFSAVVRRCLGEPVRGQPIVRLLEPDGDDYAVVKPKHSGFYATPLELLLTYLGARTLILAGLTGDACVLLTAADAYLRAYRLFVPGDCVVSADRSANRWALRYMRRVLGADIRPSTRLRLPRPASRQREGALEHPGRPPRRAREARRGRRQPRGRTNRGG